MHISPLGDKALLLEIPGAIDEETLARIRALITQLDRARIPGLTDVVPGYSSVAVHYEPLVITQAAMRAAIAAAVEPPVDPAVLQAPRTIEIPVAYGGDDGPDLDPLAARHAMSSAEVVALHCAPTYTVHMIGFVPGFPYLGGLDPRLATPRRPTPRTLVPAGSVGIGGDQTGVYPVASPGGWHLIGRTPLALFDAARAEPALLRVGDRVRFVPAARA